MKCISCEIQIDPKWKHAIDINVCPFCGNHIMDEKLKDLLSSLRVTMDSLADYTNELNDWLFSNYNFVKADSVPVRQAQAKGNLKNTEGNKFMVKVNTEDGEEEVLAEKLQSAERNEIFFKRADAIKPNIDGFKTAAEKTEHIKKMVQQIKKNGAPSLDMNENVEMISPDMLNSASAEELEELEGVLSGGDIISSSLDSDDDSDDPPDFVVNALANKAANAGNRGDLLKQKAMFDKVRESRKNMVSGSKGSFSRS